MLRVRSRSLGGSDQAVAPNLWHAWQDLRLEPVPGAAGGSGPGPRSLDKTRESKMSIPEFDITGQKVLIVGGGRGIGKGIALAFAEAGADVAVSALTPTGVNKVARRYGPWVETPWPSPATPPRRPTWIG